MKRMNDVPVAPYHGYFFEEKTEKGVTYHFGSENATEGQVTNVDLMFRQLKAAWYLESKRSAK